MKLARYRILRFPNGVHEAQKRVGLLWRGMNAHEENYLWPTLRTRRKYAHVNNYEEAEAIIQRDIRRVRLEEEQVKLYSQHEVVRKFNAKGDAL